MPNWSVPVLISVLPVHVFAPESTSVPAPIVVPPVYVLDPERVIVPVPVLAMAKVPPPEAIVPAKVPPVPLPLPMVKVAVVLALLFRIVCGRADQIARTDVDAVEIKRTAVDV